MIMKKYFVEVTVGIFMDEMDDENTPYSVAEIADNLVFDAIDGQWNPDLVTTVTGAVEVSPASLADDILNAYTSGGLDRIIANGVDLL
jgi:hypothetical protein